MTSDVQEENIKSMRYDANKKSIVVAYLLWFFVGSLGGHRFYLGRIMSAIILLILTIVCFIITFATLGLGGFVFLVPGLWLLVDLFLVPGITSAQNNQLIDDLS